MRQLSCSFAHLPEEILNLHDQHVKQGQQPQQLKLIEALFLLLRRFPRTFIIIDALDECSEREEIMDMLASLVVHKPGEVHVLITSRREQDIETGLKDIGSMSSVCLQRKAVDADIRLHVCNRINQDRKLSKWPDSVKREIESTLVDGAHGMYHFHPKPIWLYWPC